MNCWFFLGAAYAALMLFVMASLTVGGRSHD